MKHYYYTFANNEQIHLLLVDGYYLCIACTTVLLSSRKVLVLEDRSRTNFQVLVLVLVLGSSSLENFRGLSRLTYSIMRNIKHHRLAVTE